MAEEKFTYSYSPAKNSEVERIVAKYQDSDGETDDDLTRLRKLDRKAELPGTVAGIAVGLLGVLILAIGVMLLVSFSHFTAGIVVGGLGLTLAALATPVSKEVTRHSRDRYRDEILSLSKRIKNGA